MVTRFLKAIWKGWLTFVRGLGWLQVRILFTVGYILGLSPLAVGIKLTGKDILDTRRHEQHSYWKPRKPLSVEKSDYFRQY